MHHRTIHTHITGFRHFKHFQEWDIREYYEYEILDKSLVLIFHNIFC